jgi:hypothetical protein
MKHTLLILTIVLGFATSVRAGENHDHGHSHNHITIPATLPEVRAEIAAQQQKLAEFLAAKDAKAAHAATDVLSALVKAIPGKTASLDDTTLQRLQGMASNAAKAWGDAAHAAEHGNYEKAARESAKAGASYRLMESRLGT